MSNGTFSLPPPRSEPVWPHAPGSPERAALAARVAAMSAEVLEIPLVIGGREVRTGRLGEVRVPHRRGQVLARFHQAGPAEVQAAAEAAVAARRGWAELAPHHRAAVLLKAADLLAGPWRATLDAATILGQSKSVQQAEIDAACETVDFWRWNPHFMARLLADQPVSAPGQWNRLEYRALEGFVLAVTPFNFTAIGANLPTAPALMGNAVVWKPASAAVLSNWYLLKLLEAAGLPPGVINFVPGPGAVVGDAALHSPLLGGLHFTGSTGVFNGMWRTIAANLERYRGYPRIVGETGGKDFVFVHPSADLEAAAVALVRGAFEYQGQKCSAASRAYVPRSRWPALSERLVALAGSLTVGEVDDLTTFFGAVIDEAAFRRITGALDQARATPGHRILCGGVGDASRGWFVPPTIVETDDPRSRLMVDELFGPVLAVFVYDDARLDEAVALCESTSPYALTGAVFAQDRGVIADLTRRLVDAAGNFYVNDKPTGAVVGQQPFGGARASGTNDKAGSMANLMRWTSMRTVKETFDPPHEVRYPHQG
ncbi:MAG: L-glutamate gamma-semialdehyde dehydrogenase [Anaeromyxobacter sp.]|nr:L-glutamate gamma-semialdehyde dehydrogenase [Anaeromyxobacter sp.]MBL0276366.1 L-glutamate gamma-semialdehyde dehydrogenase [Anaeromyxobacter sp.]